MAHRNMRYTLGHPAGEGQGSAAQGLSAVVGAGVVGACRSPSLFPEPGPWGRGVRRTGGSVIGARDAGTHDELTVRAVRA